MRLTNDQKLDQLDMLHKLADELRREADPADLVQCRYCETDVHESELIDGICEDCALDVLTLDELFIERGQ